MECPQFSDRMGMALFIDAVKRPHGTEVADIAPQSVLCAAGGADSFDRRAQLVNPTRQGGLADLQGLGKDTRRRQSLGLQSKRQAGGATAVCSPFHE